MKVIRSVQAVFEAESVHSEPAILKQSEQKKNAARSGFHLTVLFGRAGILKVGVIPRSPTSRGYEADRRRSLGARLYDKPTTEEELPRV